MHYQDDPTAGDFCCTICECHIIGSQSYNNHLNGQRHAKNVRKLDKGKTVTQLRYVKVDDRRPQLLRLLKDVEGPIIGLNKISEKQRWNSTIIFNCNACGGTFSNNTIADHIISSKHRITIIGNDNPSYSTQICGMRLTKENLDIIVADQARTYFEEHGSGKPEVVVEKSCLTPRDLDRYMTQHTKIAYDSMYPEETAGPSTAVAPGPSTTVARIPSSDEDESTDGIFDIDIERDSDMISVDMKLDIMKCLINTMEINSDDKELAKGYVSVLEDIATFQLLHKVRQLPPVKFDKLAKEVEKMESITFDEFVNKNSYMYLSP